MSILFKLCENLARKSHVLIFDTTNLAKHSDLLSTSSKIEIAHHWLYLLILSNLLKETFVLIECLGEFRVMGHDSIIPFLEVWPEGKVKSPSFSLTKLTGAGKISNTDIFGTTNPFLACQLLVEVSQNSLVLILIHLLLVFVDCDLHQWVKNLSNEVIVDTLSDVTVMAIKVTVDKSALFVVFWVPVIWEAAGIAHISHNGMTLNQGHVVNGEGWAGTIWIDLEILR